MTQEEIMEMARQADLDWHRGWTLEDDEDEPNRFVTFAKLVAEKERDACAELRNKFHPFDLKGRQEIIEVMNTALDEYQAAIRARGQA